MDLVFRALADPTRRAILDLLRGENGQTLVRLAVRLGASRQAAAKHLAVLEEAGLVVTRRVGREKRHYLDPGPIHEVATRWIAPFERRRLDALRDLKRRLEAIDEQ